MSNTTITWVVAGACGVLALSAYVAWILIPAWTSYSTWYERVGAAFLSLYVLAAMIGVGLLGGAAVVWFWGGWTG